MFPCTGCGLCCKNISAIVELKEYDLGNGTCKYFDSLLNQCKIYEIRPKICRVDKMFELEYHKYFTKNEFYTMNAKVCNTLQKQYGINISFNVKIGD